MRFVILGPVEVRHRGRALAPLRPQSRGLLGYLLLNAGRLVTLDAVMEAVWGGAPPSTARAQVHSAVHAIRRQLRDAGCEAALASRAGGYVLDIAPDDLDASRFQRKVTEARSAMDAGAPGQALALLRDGLSLWRGPALADATGAFVEAARARLADQQLTAIEDLVEAELTLGRQIAVISEFAPLADEHPLRERLHGHIMLALYRSGRQVDALAHYQALRRRLADEQGLDPGQPLRELEQAILRADPSLDLEPAPVASPPAAAVPASAAPVTAEPTGSEPTAGPAGQQAAKPGRATLPGTWRLRLGQRPPWWPPWRSPATGAAAGVVVLALVVLVAVVGSRLGRSNSAAHGPGAVEPATVSLVNDGPPDSVGVPHIIDIAESSGGEGSPVYLRAWTTDTMNVRNQIWTAERNGSNDYGQTLWRFRNLGSHLCLDRSLSGDFPVVQAGCSDRASQLWYLDQSGRLGNEQDRRCLEIKDGAWRERASLHMWGCTSAWSQKWYMSPRRDWS
jgi:DNA-binding SARP family transcriptional activator